MGWKQKFGLASSQAMEATGIKSKATFYKAFNDLVEWGFIKVIVKSKNQNTANIISLSAELNYVSANTSALDSATKQHVYQQVNSTGNIDKQLNNETSKHLNQETKQQKDFFESDSFKMEIYPTFNDFWDIWPEKIAKQNAQKAWSKLTQKEKEKTIQHVPEFTKAKRITGQHLPHAATYLNGKRFNDEMLPQPTQAPMIQNGKMRSDDIIEILKQQSVEPNQTLTIKTETI